MGSSCELGKTGGHWTSGEATCSINALDLQAGLFVLKAFASDKAFLHVRLVVDNTTAIACVKKMGTSHSDSYNALTKQIRNFCTERDILESTAYAPGKENVDADEESRRENFDTERKSKNGFTACNRSC